MTETVGKVENALVTTARNWLVAATDQEAKIMRARSAAEGVRAGVVVNSDAEAAAAVDLAVELRDGINAIEKLRKQVLETPREMVEAVNAFAKSLAAPIESAKRTLEGAADAYAMQKRREAQRELERQQREANERAAKEAEETAAPVVPLAAPEEVGRQGPVRGVTSQRSLVERLACAWAGAPPHPWAKLDETAALGWMRGQVSGKLLEKPGIGRSNATTHNGVAFWYEVSGATRRA